MKFYKKKCEICKKIIQGLSESNVVYNLRLHLDKHKREEESK
jgi:hypothetical protein